jgi:hypothetical protein
VSALIIAKPSLCKRTCLFRTMLTGPPARSLAQASSASFFGQPCDLYDSISSSCSQNMVTLGDGKKTHLSMFHSMIPLINSFH